MRPTVVVDDDDVGVPLGKEVDWPIPAWLHIVCPLRERDPRVLALTQVEHLRGKIGPCDSARAVRRQKS